jgi:small conductance mechanosensitive channel
VPTEEAWRLLVGKLTAWMKELILLLPNLAVAVVFLIAFWLLARGVRGVAVRLLPRVSRSEQINRLLVQALYLATVAAGLLTALGILGLEKTLTSLLAGAGIIGLALSLAFQGVATNFMSGIYLSLERPFHVGNLIETNKLLGTVEKIHLLWTEIRTPQGQLVLLPNKKVFEEPITNYTEAGKRRIDLKVGIGYADDLAKARQVAIEAVAGVANRSSEVELFYEEFGESTIDFVVRFWIDATAQTDFLAARSDAIERIKRAFDEHQISLPFPTRTLDLGGLGSPAGGALARALDRSRAS